MNDEWPTQPPPQDVLPWAILHPEDFEDYE